MSKCYNSGPCSEFNIKFLVMDVDGTLTDGKVYMGEQGELFKAFDIKDGCGIKEILPKYGIIPVIITARNSEMLRKRCEELEIKEIHQGCREKFVKLKEIISDYSQRDRTEYGLTNVAYAGDDLLDLKCMIPVKEAGGLAICPANAIEEVRGIADYICTQKCGEGAIREFIDWYTMKSDGRKIQAVKELSEVAYDFIVNFNPSAVKDGGYKLGNGVIANVMTYTTKPVVMTCYESHRKYIDVQYMVYGEELMFVEDTEKLSGVVTQDYDEKRDVELYDYNGGDIIVLKSGEAMIMYPENAHRGAVAIERPMQIRKIVLKVPV